MSWLFALVLLSVGAIIGFGIAAVIVVCAEESRKEERKWWWHD